jgi:hypothetical protein
MPVWAVEYRLQVTHISEMNFSANLDRSSSGPRGQETMKRLEARLDRMEFSPHAVIPGRELQMLEDPVYGGQVPSRLVIRPPTGQESWTTAIWDALPGTRVAFEVRSYMSAWQEVWDLADNGTGALQRLTIGGPATFGAHTRQVPAVPNEFLANAANQGTFVPWVIENGASNGGMSLAIGRRHERLSTVDRVYMLLTLPEEPHTFKVVIGWKNYRDRSDGRNFRMER